MIKEIKENFPKLADGTPQATLEKATVTFNDMGERTITSQIKIDGQIMPDFSVDWEVEFKGEKYIMPLRKPQASKANDSLNSKIDLTFQHWAIYQLKRWYFVTLQPLEAGVMVTDKYNASVSLNLGNFIDLFSQLLEYYFGDAITIDLNEKWEYAAEPTFVDINYSYMWDVLIKLHELYSVRWQIEPNGDPDHYVIKVGYDAPEMNHIFEYGFEGGLLKVERQVQNDNIRNILVGRGGEKNLPYRYYKNFDSTNPTFPADPDWVYELANIPFNQLRSAEFRSYVQGWKYAHRSEYLVYNESGDGVVGVKDNSRFVGRDKTLVKWAWDKGNTDEKFDAVEFVADEIANEPNPETTRDIQLFPTYTAPVVIGSSIDKYGPLLGGLNDNEEIYPSIQGVVRDNVELPDGKTYNFGRVDQAVDVEQVTTDAPEDANSITDASLLRTDTFQEVQAQDFVTIGPNAKVPIELEIGRLEVDEGKRADVYVGELDANITIWNSNGMAKTGKTANEIIGFLHAPNKQIYAYNLQKPDEELAGVGLPAGTYRIVLRVEIENRCDAEFRYKLISKGVYVKFHTEGKSSYSADRTFDIWVKNIWGTKKGINNDGTTIKGGETDEEYVKRVWTDILGNHLGEEAAICFSSGLLSTSEDYEFKIVGPITTGIHYDTSKSYHDPTTGEDYTSEWRITCLRSDADYDSLGLFVPNTTRQGAGGDYFYFIGINLTQYYVEWAEERLYNYKRDELEKIKDIMPTWVVGLDKIRIDSPQFNEATTLLEQLQLGGTIRLADKRFISAAEYGQAYIPLYIQTLTYKFNDGSNSANFTPNVEIVLGDDYKTSANPVATLQGAVDTINRQLGNTSVSNIQQIVRAVGDKIYLRKDGLTDRSISETFFAEMIASLGFRQGMVGGEGWAFFQDENGKWVLETDRVNIREDMQVNNLVINQIQARGGMIIESAASLEISYIEEDNDGWRCYFDLDSGTVGNLFVIDDIAYCHRFNIKDESLKYYKAQVIGVGEDYIKLSKKEINRGSDDDNPAVGDVLVQYGNYTNNARQFVIERDTINGGYERMLCNLDSVYADGDEYYFAGYQSSDKSARFFVGNRANNEYIEFKGNKFYIPGRLLLGADMQNGSSLEQYLNNAFASKSEIDKYQYLYEATKEGTLINGGLILSSLIQLGKTNTLNQWVFWWVITGIPIHDSNKGYGIAAWYGGDMWDEEKLPIMPSYIRPAKSLFRFDGTGYLAGGNISWNTDGSGKLAGGDITWDSNGSMTFGNGIKIAGGTEGNDTLESVLNFVNNLSQAFVPIDSSLKELSWTNAIKDSFYAIKSRKGFFSEEFISVVGINDKDETLGGGGGDVTIVQEITSSTTDVPSANAVREALQDVIPSVDVSELKDFIEKSGAAFVMTPRGNKTYFKLTNGNTIVGSLIVTTGFNSTSISIFIVTTVEIDTDSDEFFKMTSSWLDGKVNFYSRMYHNNNWTPWVNLRANEGGGGGTQEKTYTKEILNQLGIRNPDEPWPQDEDRLFERLNHIQEWLGLWDGNDPGDWDSLQQIATKDYLKNLPDISIDNLQSILTSFIPIYTSFPTATENQPQEGKASVFELANALGMVMEQQEIFNVIYVETESINEIRSFFEDTDDLRAKTIFYQEWGVKIGTAKQLTTYNGQKVITFETLCKMSPDGVAMNADTDTLKTYSSKYNGSKWSDWKLVNEIEL